MLFWTLLRQRKQILYFPLTPNPPPSINIFWLRQTWKSEINQHWVLWGGERRRGLGWGRVYLQELLSLRNQVNRGIFQLLSHRSREDKRCYSVACPAYKTNKAEDYKAKEGVYQAPCFKARWLQALSHFTGLDSRFVSLSSKVWERITQRVICEQLTQSTLSGLIRRRSSDSTWKCTFQTKPPVTSVGKRRQRGTFWRYSYWIETIWNFQHI